MCELLRRLRYYLHRSTFERDLDDEMRHHLALKAERNPAGAPFGNITLLKEDSRAVWNFHLVDHLAQDLRYALRTMRANPLFTATAALSLALGIGANTAIFSFMDSILLRTLPVQNPDQLVIFHWRAPRRPAVVRSISGSSHGDGAGGMTSPNFPFVAFDLFSADHQSFANVFGYSYGQRLNLLIHNQPDSAVAIPVTGNYFSALGVNPAAGRLLTTDDDHPGAPLLAALTYDYWKRRFAENPAVIGETIISENRQITIIGVAAPGFFGIDPGNHPDLFLPIHATEDNSRFFDPQRYWLEMTARLAPGVTLKQAQTGANAQFARFAEAQAATSKDREVLPQVWLEPGASGLDSLRRQYSQPLRVLMTMAVLILSIACANLANVLLARASARRREIAVRLSLGAGRARIVRQLLTESVLLSVIGGALGIAFAAWGIRSITWLIANGRRNFTLYAELNRPVLAFTVFLSLVTGIVFGLAPALQATRLDLTPALRKAPPAIVTGPRRWFAGLSPTRLLIVAQMAISLLLVIGAAVFVRNLVHLNSIDLGFNRDQLLVFNLNPRQAGYRGDAAVRFLTTVRDRIRNVPGVLDAGLSNFPLVAHYVNSTNVIVPGFTDQSKTHTQLLDVDPGLLPTLQIPILLGRGLESRDLSAPNAVVVNQNFADTFFSAENPLGRHFSLKDDPGDFEIVGIARNAHYNSIEEKIGPVAYLPFTRSLKRVGGMVFAVRTAGNPLAFAGAIREVVRQESPAVLMTGITTQEQIISQTIGQQRTFANLGACFAILALLIACVGLYGAMAYAVARRTSEIGIRMALGARPTILWMVMREVLLLCAIGFGAGYFASRQLAHWIESFLFQLKPTDPTAAVIAISILFAAALLAGYFPAWRASRLHPMTALRHE
jgi:predicted permease